jgi:hypothetical protein
LESDSPGRAIKEDGVTLVVWPTLDEDGVRILASLLSAGALMNVASLSIDAAG